MILALCAAGYGIAAALVFRRLTDAARIRAAVNRMLAHVMEFALFIDEPAVVFRAQIELVRENLRLLRAVALPCVVMGVSFAALYPAMDRQFGRVDSNVLTLPMGRALPPGVVAVTPGVRVTRTHEVSWRVRRSGVARTYPFGLHWAVWFAIGSVASGSATAFLLRR